MYETLSLKIKGDFFKELKKQWINTDSFVEETAAAGEEIRGQAAMMKDVVENSNTLVRGRAGWGSADASLIGEKRIFHLEEAPVSQGPVRSVRVDLFGLSDEKRV